MSHNDFYILLTNKLTRDWATVDLYSISSCFGFYSRGMKVFSDVLHAMRGALTKPEPFKTKPMRLLVVADDNPVDFYGIERFHQFLEPKGLEIKRLDKPEREDQWIQFAIFKSRSGETSVLYTRPQDGFRDEALDLGINRLAGAVEIAMDSDGQKVNSFVSLFNDAWSSSEQFDFPRIPSVIELEQKLEGALGVLTEDGISERELGDHLRWLLCGVCDPSVIHRDYQIGSDKFDFVIGDPKIRLTAIELKIATNDEGELKRLKGQVETYRQSVRDVLVLLVGAGITPAKLRELRRWFATDPHVRILHIR